MRRVMVFMRRDKERRISERIKKKRVVRTAPREGLRARAGIPEKAPAKKAPAGERMEKATAVEEARKEEGGHVQIARTGDKESARRAQNLPGNEADDEETRESSS